MTILINFFGGPGAGKTERSHELYLYMHSKKLSVTYVSEFASKLIHDGDEDILKRDPLYVFATQCNWITEVMDNYNYVICDSPMAISAAYLKNYPFGEEELRKFIISFSKQFNNVNLLLRRGRYKFTTVGRIHTERERVY